MPIAPGDPPPSGGGAGLVPGTPSDIDIQLFDGSTGLRKYLPPVHACNFSLTERGGMAEGSLEIQSTWEELDLDGSEFADVLLFGVRIYRGWVRISNRQVSSPEYLSISLQSIVEIMNRYSVRWKLAYGQPTDLATIAGDLITDFVQQTDRLTGHITTSLTPTDITLEEFDYRGRSVSQALNQLCEHASGNAVWGVSPGASGASWTNTLYFKPKPTATGKHYSIGGLITGYAHPKDTGTVINVVNLTGGPAKQPNLVYNGSFEEVAPQSETVGNLLIDYSFEDGHAAWTLTGSRKFTGMDATARGVPKSGKYWLELDQNTESGIQVVLAPYTVEYTASCWVRQETAGTGREVKLTVAGLDSGNSVVVTADTGFVVAADDWEKISVDLDPTGSSTVVKIRVTIETNGGTANQDGVLVDDVALIEQDGIGQVGWRRLIGGAADASVFDWAYKTNNFSAANRLRMHGGYCVLIDSTGISSGSDYVEIRTTPDKRIEVPPNERITFLVACRTDGSSTFTMGIIEYDSAGAQIGSVHESDSYTQVVNTSVHMFQETASTEGNGFTTTSTCRSIEVFIRYRDTAADTTYFDKVFVCVGAKPDDIIGTNNVITNYWTGENFQRRFRVDDAIFTGGLALDAAAAASITEYGEREADENNDFAIDEDSAAEWAQDYFNVFAVPSVMARLEIGQLEAAEQLLTCADSRVQIHNLPNAPDALNPVSIHYTIMSDKIGFSADLGSETPTFAELFRIAEKRERGRHF